VTEPTRTPNQIELRARFDAELQAAGLAVTGDDRERLYEMWVDYLPRRDELREVAVALEEAPTFIEKPTVGLERPAAGRGGA
jgi:hypothetical protein